MLFESIEAFYAADERRRYSGESDFGVWWWDGEPWASPNYRVSAIDTTGELYAVRLGARRGLVTVDGPAGEIAMFAQAGPEGEVELLAGGLEPGYDDAEQVLAGWAEVCGRPASMTWIRERLLTRC